MTTGTATRVPWSAVYDNAEGKREMKGYAVADGFDFGSYLDTTLHAKALFYSGAVAFKELVSDIAQTGFQDAEIYSVVHSEISQSDIVII